MGLKDKVAIVTGAGVGIGRAAARRLGAEGAQIVVADASRDAAEEVAGEIVKRQGEAIAFHCEVAKKLDLNNLLAATLEAFDRVDILVNAAELEPAGGVLELKEDDLDRALRVNLKAPLLLTQLVARQMIAQAEAAEEIGPAGAIVNISSVSAVTANAAGAAYAATKGGLNQLTRAMAVDLAPHRIRVNAVGVGVVMTEAVKAWQAGEGERDRILARTPLGRIGEPSEIAAIVAFLASEEASYMTGQCVYADGGRLALGDPGPARA